MKKAIKWTYLWTTLGSLLLILTLALFSEYITSWLGLVIAVSAFVTASIFFGLFVTSVIGSFLAPRSLTDTNQRKGRIGAGTLFILSAVCFLFFASQFSTEAALLFAWPIALPLSIVFAISGFVELFSKD